LIIIITAITYVVIPVYYEPKIHLAGGYTKESGFVIVSAK